MPGWIRRYGMRQTDWCIWKNIVQIWLVRFNDCRFLLMRNQFSLRHIFIRKFIRFISLSLLLLSGTVCDDEEGATSCDPNPCEHGGTCIDFEGGYFCNCPSGKDGDHCEKGERPRMHIGFMQMSSFKKLDDRVFVGLWKSFVWILTLEVWLWTFNNLHLLARLFLYRGNTRRDSPRVSWTFLPRSPTAQKTRPFLELRALVHDHETRW